MGDKTWSEFEIINRFFRTIGNRSAEGVITGIGDDAAVISETGKQPLLITHDMMIEDIHYKSRWMSPFQLARKLVAVNVSDIAAMGGIPLYALLALALPDPMEKGWIEGFRKGLGDALKSFGISLIGGDTSQSPGPVMVALTLFGKNDGGTPVLRHHPKAGDTLYVTGTLGDAALGLTILNQKGQDPALTEEETFLARRHLDPTPRVGLGREIASKQIATAMIDISDGLIADLDHLLEGASIGAEIHVESLPCSEAFKQVAPRYHESPEILALSGGEDYELLFTSPIPPDKLTLSPPTAVTPIGRITDTPGITILKHGNPVSLDARGFQHLFHQKG